MTRPDIDITRDLAKPIDGWLHDYEGELLYTIAKNCAGSGVIVEVGSWKGKSTTWIGRGSRRGKSTKIYAIDPHVGSTEHQAGGKVWTFEEFVRNIKASGIDDIVVPMVKTSEDAAKEVAEPVEFVFIDGAHEYDFVKLDYELWYPKVITGGTMAFHDTIGWIGPKKVVSEDIAHSRHFRKMRFVHSITTAVKVPENSIFDRMHNRYVLLLKGLYEIIHNQNPPKIVRIFFIRFFLLLQGS